MMRLTRCSSRPCSFRCAPLSSCPRRNRAPWKAVDEARARRQRIKMMLEGCWRDAGGMLDRCWTDAGRMLVGCQTDVGSNCCWRGCLGQKDSGRRVLSGYKIAFGSISTLQYVVPARRNRVSDEQCLLWSERLRRSRSAKPSKLRTGLGPRSFLPSHLSLSLSLPLSSCCGLGWALSSSEYD